MIGIRCMFVVLIIILTVLVPGLDGWCIVVSGSSSRRRCLNRRTAINFPGLSSAHLQFHKQQQQQQQQQRQQKSSFCILLSSSADNNDNDDDDIVMDDVTLLKQVSKEQLLELCRQCNLSNINQSASKSVLLQQLRTHAAEQAALERQRYLERAERVESGSSATNTKERYELVSDVYDDDDDLDDDDDDEAFFYYPDPTIVVPTNNNNNNATKATTTTTTTQNNQTKTHIPHTVVTAPPAPAEPNEQGERVVTIYSTTDANDLTGVAAAQPGSFSSTDGILGIHSGQGGVGGESSQPWDQPKKQTTSDPELEKAKEKLTELIQTLLSMTGLPAFALETIDNDDDDDDNNDNDNVSSSFTKVSSFDPDTFVGFQPGLVPTELLTSYSNYLLAGRRGSVLKEVLRSFELQAIGQDGMAGDNLRRGGGHYIQVQKVGAFCEGYRQAQVQRQARQTVAMLLDKLVQEGVTGLDVLLQSMVRSNSDTASDLMYADAQLNDALLDYLNDAIRQQQRKVDQLKVSVNDSNDNDNDDGTREDDDDPINQMWNVTTSDDGQRMETIDPNDPHVQQFLRDELKSTQQQQQQQQSQTQLQKTILPDTAPEQLLLLLTLLRNRIKAEATFVPDEKGRNLRLLAYCLQVPTDEEREQLILQEVGTSLDRLDSFIELVASSVEYGESTSYELQPAKKQILNVPMLRNILDLAEHLKERQNWKASIGAGGHSNNNNNNNNMMGFNPLNGGGGGTLMP